MDSAKTQNILNSYLSQRQQKVIIDDMTSSYRTVSYRVLQGTVLGPMLFTTIYLNGLLDLQAATHLISFADDTAISYKADKWQTRYQINYVFLLRFDMAIEPWNPTR